MIASSHRCWIVLCVFLLFGSAGALGNTATDWAQEEIQTGTAGDRQKPPEAQAQAAPAKNPGLVKIDLLQLDLSTRVERVQYRSSKPIHEVLNPFTARKRARIYGSLYEYHRNDNFDARNFFDPVGKKLPEYKRNQFGGSLGLFLTKQLTLFGTYDGLRINQGSTILSHVPTPAMKRGDFSGLGKPLLNPWTGMPFTNNQISPSLFHPAAVKVLAAIPDPNLSDPVRNFVNSRPKIDDRDTYTAQVDCKFGEDSKLFANYSLRNAKGFEVAPLPDFGLTTRSREQDVSINFARDLGPNFVASITASFSREAQTELAPQAGEKGLLASLGIGGLKPIDALDEGYPDFELAGYASLGSGDSPTTTYLNEYGLELGLTWVRKNHELEFGAEIQVGQINNDRTGGMRRGSFEFDGNFTGDAFADFLLGIPTTVERGVGSDRADVRRRSWRAYIADDWKISPMLSLSAALAYDFTPFAHSVRDNVYTFAPLLFEPPVDGAIVRTGTPEAARSGLAGLRSGYAVFPDRDDWEPSLGLAYSPFGNSRLVIRASYAITHGSRDMDESFDVLGRSYPVYYAERAESSEDEPGLSLTNPFNAAVPVESRIYGAEPHWRNPFRQQWQLVLQNEIFPKWNLELAYSGNKATHDDRFLVANVPLPGPGLLQDRRPNPNYGQFSILSSGVSSSGNSLKTSLRKRLSRGFSLETSWTWNRAFSDATGTPSNPRNLRAERAPSGAPLHAASLIYIWDLPIGPERAISAQWAGKLRSLLAGWRISGITSIQTGNYLHPVMPGDSNNDGVRADRPNRLASGVLSAQERSVNRWFATEAFEAPLPYTFGNSGRNILVGPGKHKWDISFIKRTQVSREGSMLELRIQMFNAFNHANFSTPKTTLGTSVFGKIFGADRAREIEIAIKYTF
jgi:hypothetical protein